jgi:hypothetical protein
MKTAWIPTLLALCAGASAFEFKHQTIDDKIGVGYGLAIADVNGDKKPDVLLVDAHQVAWYENPSWKKHVMTEKLTERDHVCITAADIDGDGKAEVAVGAGWNPGDTEKSGAVFYLVAPEDRTQKWTSVALPHEPTVHRMWWVRNEEGKHGLVVSPLHGRGNKGGAGEGARLLEYVVPADPKEEWTTRLIDGSMHMTHNLDPFQWDRDPAWEILYGGKEAIVLLDRQGDEWTKSVIASPDRTPGFAGAGEVRVGKARGDFFVASIEPMHGTDVAIYTRSGDSWKREVIDATLKDGHAVATGDLLKQARDQVVVGWRGKDANGKVGIRMFQAKGDEWIATTVDDNEMACEDLKIADLNNDTWLDIVAAGRATKNVKIYWNPGSK